LLILALIKLTSEASEEFLAQHAINNSPSPKINPITDRTFYFHHIQIDNIPQALMRFKLTRQMYTGLDKIRSKVLRISADNIAPSLTYIFNLILDAGIYMLMSGNVRK
jgi:hypothetical protein